MNKKSSWIVLLAAVMSSLVLGGCGTFRLYSEVRDKQGAAAKKAWEEVDLKEIVTTERANLKKLLEAELEAQDRLAAGIRNYTLRNMVDSESLDKGLVKEIDKRLNQLAGSRALVKQSLDAREKQRAAELKLEGEFLPDFERKNLQQPSCSALAGGATPPAITKWLAFASKIDATEMERILKEMRRICLDAGVTPYEVFGDDSKIMVAWKQYKSDSEALEKSRQAAAKLQVTYLLAVAQYDKAIEEAKSNEAVQETTAKLAEAVAALGRAQDAFSVSFLSEERLKAIDKLIVAITETGPGDKLPEGADRATVAFILIPRLLDDARRSLYDAKKPLAIPLLMRRNYEQLNLEAAKRDIASHETMVRLSGDIVAALYQQALQLYTASIELDQPSLQQYYNLPVLEAFSKPPPKDREPIYSAAARYLDALNRLDAKRYKLEYMRIAAIHERSLAYAEVNTQQWQSLIGITVDQVADFSAGGIKPETIGNLINTLGILSIGVGVNR